MGERLNTLARYLADNFIATGSSFSGQEIPEDVQQRAATRWIRLTDRVKIRMMERAERKKHSA